MPDFSFNTDANSSAETDRSAASGNSGDVEDFGSPEERRGRLEAVLFLAKEPLNTRKLAQLAKLVDGTDARTLSRQLNRLYDENGRAFRIEEIAGGLQLRTRPAFSSWIRRMGHVPRELRLSGPSMETLSVVAYRQPVIRADIEAIRGVACGEILRQLLERDLVRIAGRSEELGRPFFYGTTKQFLQVFGLRSLDELPRAGVFRDALVDNTSDRSQAGHDSIANVDPTDEGVTDVSVTVEQETDLPTALAIDEKPAVALVASADEQAGDGTHNEIVDDEDFDDEELDDDDVDEDDEELGDDEEWVYEDDEEEDDEDDEDEDELEDDEEWEYEDDDGEDDDDELDDEDEDDDELGDDEEWVYEDDDDDEEWVEVGDDEDDEDDDDELGDDEEWVYEDDDEDEEEDEDELGDDEDDEELGVDEEWVDDDDDEVDDSDAGDSDAGDSDEWE